MAELEKRQDHLLQQLDILYERIKSLSSLCKDQPVSAAVQNVKKPQIAAPAEIIVNASADHLPFFLLVLAKGSLKNKIALTYHIHSSVPAASVGKIKEFMKLVDFKSASGAVHVKLIFKEIGAKTELKLSLSGVPIVGEVNILRYLAYVFPNEVPYDEVYSVDSLLDECYVLQRSGREETSAESTLQRLFLSYKGDWIAGERFCIVDIAAISVIKQIEATTPKLCRYVPKPWLEKANQLLK